MSEMPKSDNVPTLCLNMIVKNESKIITRLLKSVVDIVDSYCICDTGSTDDTIEIIETFFQEKGISGKIVQEPFRDFGYNRSVALKACENMENADYILLLDADMLFKLSPGVTANKFKQTLLNGHTFYVFQGSDQFYYKNTRITKNNCGSSYWGVTHEYLKTPEGVVNTLIDKNVAFIYDIGDGGCKGDKYERDIRLLQQGLIDHPNNDRYTFYLANSYRNAGQIENAIEMYKKRTELGGWCDEIWNSYYNIAQCYSQRGDMPNAIHYYMEAYNSYPERIENLHAIIHHYRVANKPHLGYVYYHTAKHQLMQNKFKDYLFMQKDIYDYKLDYEMTIIGYYCNSHNYDLALLATNVLNYVQLPIGIRQNVWSNYKFYTPMLSSLQCNQYAELGSFLTNLGTEEMVGNPDFLPSTPSIVKIDKNRYVVCKRFVNYSINSDGNYTQKSKIETKNVLSVFYSKNHGSDVTVESTTIVKHNTNNDGRYVGLEDMRLFEQSYNNDDNTILYSANRGMPDGTMTVEIGRLHIHSGETSDVKYPKVPGQGQIEKNWVWLPTHEENPPCNKMIYGWNPLRIGSIETDDNQITHFQETHNISTPGILHDARGSTNGIIVGDDIWFIIHSVSYEDRRYYYHMLVALDKETYNVTKYTKPFRMDNDNKVEYTLGFTHDSETDTFLIGYSVMDCETKFMAIPRSKVNLESS